MPRTLDIETLIKPDGEAVEIARYWREWVVYRNKKVEEWKELRNYLFATDTKTTSNKALPWSNSTTTPKLTQIRDNLHANYMAALFPQRNWFKWVADSRDSNTMGKKKAVTSYVRTKTEQSKFKDTVSRLVLDWIDTGNAFATVDYLVDIIDHGGGDSTVNYIGPKVRRISPYDIVFNPVVESFYDTPKIIKELVTVGDLQRKIQSDINEEYLSSAFEDMLKTRASVSQQDAEFHKADGFIADGFSSITNYYKSGYVELLHFIGDLYNVDTGELKLNRIITVADRSKVLRDIPNPSWLGNRSIRHIGWRQRPDNIYGMGPLDNLVGLQYRIDHLENMKADVWDQIAYPIQKIRGDVRQYNYAPGTKIFLGDEGDVEYLVPDATVLQAEIQIAELMNKMEELAGAPRQAMGIRTPGEKTAFEVGVLDKGAARVFQHKAQWFEENFLEDLLNDMLEVGRRNLNGVEEVKVTDPDTGIDLFNEVTKEDITAIGRMRPIGSRHFDERALRLQNLQTLWQMKVGDPTVGVHISGKELARILTEELGEDALFSDNVAIFEQTETQGLMEEAAVSAEEEQLIALEEGI